MIAEEYSFLSDALHSHTIPNAQRVPAGSQGELKEQLDARHEAPLAKMTSFLKHVQFWNSPSSFDLH